MGILSAEAAPGEASRSEAEWACRRLRELSLPLVIGRFSLSRGGSFLSLMELSELSVPLVIGSLNLSRGGSHAAVLILDANEPD